MLEEEKNENVDVIESEIVENLDPIAERDAEIAKLTEERDNYRNVALKRLGKLPDDSAFLGEDGKEINLLIEEKVKAALLDKEIASVQAEKEAKIKQLARENAELKLALKNRPSQGIGSGDGGNSAVEVKDNIFTPEQIEVLKQKAERLKVDPERFIQNAKKNFLARR